MDTKFITRHLTAVLTIQARCRPEDTWVFKAHAPPPRACDNIHVALKLLANLQEKKIIDDVYEGIKKNSKRKVVAALRQVIEVHHHKAVVSVKLLDQHHVAILKMTEIMSYRFVKGRATLALSA